MIETLTVAVAIAAVPVILINFLTPYRVFFCTGTSMGVQFGYFTVGYGKVSKSYSVGDIVAFRRHSNKKRLMHRIISVSGDRFVIQGDNRTDEEDCVSLSDIEYKVARFVKVI